MKKKKQYLFGTDGIRGTPGVYPLTDGMIYKIGRSAAHLIYYQKRKDTSPKVIIAKDTRISGNKIEAILAEAITFHGIDVYLAGIIPTPGLSYLVSELNANMGIMISASHNKPTENGLKFFLAGGYKISPKAEEFMEEIIFSNLIRTSNGSLLYKKAKTYPLEDAELIYAKFLTSTLGYSAAEGIKVSVDCAWGATASIAKKVFKKLRTKASFIHDLPKGENINGGGAVNPGSLRELVLDTSSDIGLAFDGDGDRVILIDHKGNILDGDHILAITSLHLLRNNSLPRNTLVTTVMSNYGLKLAVENAGGKIIFTKVGDKYVLEALLANNLILGGEQSGHIIFLNYSPSPDGLLTALQILKILEETNIPLNELAKCLEKLPQVLVNVKVKTKVPFESVPPIYEAITYYSHKLRERGRLLVRYSGTEDIARIMVEGKDNNLIEDIACSLAGIIQEEIGE